MHDRTDVPRCGYTVYLCHGAPLFKICTLRCGFGFVQIVIYFTCIYFFFFFFQAEDGIRDYKVTGVQTCALPIFGKVWRTEVLFIGSHGRRLGTGGVLFWQERFEVRGSNEEFRMKAFELCSLDRKSVV